LFHIDFNNQEAKMLQAVIESESPEVNVESKPVQAGPDLFSYDRFLVAFSGGKDSTAVALDLFKKLIEAGLTWEQIKDRVELWHHDIDGELDDEGSGGRFMDWPITKDYCRKFAEAFGIPIYFSWKVGGFWREMHRENSLTAPTKFEYPDENGMVKIGQVGGTRGKPSTRRKFPQVSPDLSVRWCSAYLKIDVMSAAIRAQKRFEGKKTLVLTGERAEESGARAKYLEFEPHRSNLSGGDGKRKRKQRRVDHWRPVHKWSEKEVWDIIQEFGVIPHPAYYLGFGRVSCATCIFGNANQWASVGHVLPEQTMKVWEKENEFDKEAKANPKIIIKDVTDEYAGTDLTGLENIYMEDGRLYKKTVQIQGGTIHRNKSVGDLISKGEVYEAAKNTEMVAQARSEKYTGQIIVDPNDWTLPAGAYGESCGPT